MAGDPGPVASQAVHCQPPTLWLSPQHKLTPCPFEVQRMGLTPSKQAVNQEGERNLSIPTELWQLRRDSPHPLGRAAPPSPAPSAPFLDLHSPSMPCHPSTPGLKVPQGLFSRPIFYRMGAGPFILYRGVSQRLFAYHFVLGGSLLCLASSGIRTHNGLPIAFPLGHRLSDGERASVVVSGVLCVSELSGEVKGLLLWMHTCGLYMGAISRSGTRVCTCGETRSVVACDLSAEAAASGAMEGKEQLWVHTYEWGGQCVGQWRQ